LTCAPALLRSCTARLHTLVEARPEARHLIHRDLLHFDVLVDGGRVGAVLDRGGGRYGDVRYDVAWLVCFRPWYPAWSGIDSARVAAQHDAATGPDVPDLGTRRRCCEVPIGRGGRSWNAHKKNRAEPERPAPRPRAVARAAPGERRDSSC
jgi:hypothetical protein